MATERLTDEQINRNEITASHGARLDYSPSAKIHHGVTVNLMGQFASSLITRWGMVQGKDDGEDSAGRAKISLMTPEEVVNRACETAETTFKEFNKRGWLIAVPNQKELQKMIDADEQKRKEGK